MSAQPVEITKDVDLRSEGHHLTTEEAHAIFEENARYYLGLSGDEFIRKWDAGGFDDAEAPGVWDVAILLPLSR